MSAVAGSRKTMGEAFAGSLGLHILVALFIPAIAFTVASSNPVETISFVKIAHIEIIRPKVAPVQPRAEAPHQSKTVAVTFVTRAELSHARRHDASPPPAVQRADSVAPTVGSQSKAGVAAGSTQSDAAPQPTATPAQVASNTGHQAGGYMPFTAEQPVPVLDPGILKQLQGMGIHVTLVVTVDDDGKTKNVAFQPALDPDMQAKIQALLADASWDPAVCGGGIACEGQATIKL